MFDALKNGLIKAVSFAVPAASFQYVLDSVKSFVNYGVQFGPAVPWEILMYNKLKPKLRAEKIAKEGYRNDVYEDSLGYLTVGIGHKVIPSDNLKFGDRISNERIEKLFDQDCQISLKAAIAQAVELRGKNVSESFIMALSQVNFQLGIYWRTKFPNTWTALKTGNWQTAINNLKVSAWAKQTPVRVAAFTNAIREEYA